MHSQDAVFLGVLVHLRLVSFNIHHGEGVRGDSALEAQAKLLRDLDSDVAFLQEVDVGVVRSDRVNQAAFLAERSGLSFHVFGKNMDLGGGAYGNAILSRFKLTWGAHYVIPAVDPHVPRLFEGNGQYYLPEPRGILRADARIDGVRHCLLCAHFGFLRQELKEGVDAVLALLRRTNMPVLLGSDMNTMDRNAPELFRLREEMVDCASALSQEGVATYPSDDPVERLDYVLVRGPYRVTTLDVVPSLSSDHRPVVAELELLPQEVAAPAGKVEKGAV